MTSPQFVETTVGYNRFFVDRRYTQIKPAGTGAYGLVASALDTVTGNRVAIKKIKDTFIDLVDAKRVLREIKLLRHFNAHENIITILDIMTFPPDTVDFQDIYIVTNLMESDLERIIQSRQALTDQHFQYFLYQILRGLKYIHSANVLHRDLKPSNLLVNADCDLAVCDFGLARGFRNEGKDTLTEYVVTRWYRCPELLCESVYYGKGVDMWGIGCIFAELLTHDAFFKGDNPQHQLQAIVNKLGCPNQNDLHFVSSQAALDSLLRNSGRQPPQFESLFPRHVNPQALDLLRRMLEINPDKRISVEDALLHPYLKEFQGQMPEPLCEKNFDFEFETSKISMDEDLTKTEVQLHMYTEMMQYRPDQVRGYQKFIRETEVGRALNEKMKRREYDYKRGDGKDMEEEDLVMYTPREDHKDNNTNSGDSSDMDLGMDMDSPSLRNFNADAKDFDFRK
tara:strand:+ start:571 stop:1929 length:1359 start_codon:yes stop_codon:yes gene_type:complete